MNKKLLFFFVIFLSVYFISASATLGNLSHSIDQYYGKSNLLRGWINVSFSQEPLSLEISTLGQKISLEELLKKNNIDCTLSNSCSCVPTDCLSKYAALGSGSSTMDFPLGVLDNAYVGVKITGNVSHITEFKFNVTTNSGKSCLRPILIDLFNDESIDYTAQNIVNDTCHIEKPYGCFNSSEVLGSVNISANSLCEKINLPPGKGYKIGANILGSGSSNLLFSLEVNSFQKTCSVTVNNAGEIFCTVQLDDALTSDAAATVCVSSTQTSPYTINYEDTSPCGYIDEQGNRFAHDFELFAKPLMYGPVSEIGINQKYFGETNLSMLVFNYVEEKYGGNCNPECVIPIKIYSGVNQEVKMHSLLLKYKADGLEKNAVTDFYKLNKTSALLNSGFIKISLFNFSVPSVLGEKNITLNVSDKKIGAVIYVRNVPTIKDINPKNTALLVSTEFTAVFDGALNASSFEWDFGDGSQKVLTTTNSVFYTYKNVGIYSLKVNVSNSLGSTLSTFSINVTTPFEAINETLAVYRDQLRKVDNKISTLPVWVKDKSKISIADLQSSVNRIENDYKQTFRNEDEKLIKMMNELIVLKVPKDFDTSLIINPTPYILNKNFDVASLEEFGAGTVDDEDYYTAISSWLNENMEITLDSKTYSYYYGVGKEDQFSHVKIVFSPKIDIDEFFMVIEGDVAKIKLKEDYGEREITNGYGIRFNDLIAGEQKVIEFIHPQRVDFLATPVIVSPAFNELSFGIDTGVCNYNNVCDSGENTSNCRADCKPWKLSLILIFVLLFFALAVYILLQEWYKRYYESHLFKDKNQLFNLMAFMKNAEAQKMGRDDIFNRLRQFKWSKEQLNYAWKKLHGKRTGMWEIPVFMPFERKKVNQEMLKRKNVGFGK